MNNNSYFTESWRMLTRNRGWAKPLLVMAAAALVPVAGALGNDGYALEWARLSAWGVDSSPKQKNVQVVKCIESGWRGFVAGVGWIVAFSLASSIVSGIVGLLPGAFGALVAALVALALSLGSALVALVAKVASVRATIYQKAAAGYRVETVWAMLRRDTEGFLRVFAANLLCMLALAVLGGMMAGVLLVELVPLFVQIGDTASEAEVLRAVSAMLVPLALTCAVLGYGVSIVANAVDLVVTNAIGLWMRQFDVPAWGRDEDPLPAPRASAPYVAPYAWDQGSYQTQDTYQDSYGEPAQDAYADFSSLPQQIEDEPATQGGDNPMPDEYEIALVPADQDYETAVPDDDAWDDADKDVEGLVSDSEADWAFASADDTSDDDLYDDAPFGSAHEPGEAADAQENEE